MMHFKTTKDEARWLYSRGLEVAHIARLLHRNVRTISNYKIADGNWDELRFKQLCADANGKPLWDNFKTQMHRGIEEINDSVELNATEKAAAVAKLGDAYAKMKKIADVEDPTTYKLSIAKTAISVLMNEVARLGNEKLNEHFKEFLTSGAVENALAKKGLL